MDSTPPRIRAVRPDEPARLRAIERAAGVAFAEIGMPEIAADEPLPEPVLARYATQGRAWVAVDALDEPIAYVLVDLVDDAAHVEQVSVHPKAARRGVGRALLDHVAAWALERHLTAVTLTTFRDVPWNAPYYERCGFSVLHDDDLGDGLRAVRDQEARHGLDPGTRVCMRRPLQ